MEYLSLGVGDVSFGYPVLIDGVGLGQVNSQDGIPLTKDNIPVGSFLLEVIKRRDGPILQVDMDVGSVYLHDSQQDEAQERVILQQLSSGGFVGSYLGLYVKLFVFEGVGFHVFVQSIDPVFALVPFYHAINPVDASLPRVFQFLSLLFASELREQNLGNALINRVVLGLQGGFQQEIVERDVLPPFESFLSSLGRWWRGQRQQRMRR